MRTSFSDLEDKKLVVLVSEYERQGIRVVKKNVARKMPCSRPPKQLEMRLRALKRTYGKQLTSFPPCFFTSSTPPHPSAARFRLLLPTEAEKSVSNIFSDITAADVRQHAGKTEENAGELLPATVSSMIKVVGQVESDDIFLTLALDLEMSSPSSRFRPTLVSVWALKSGGTLLNAPHAKGSDDSLYVSVLSPAPSPLSKELLYGVAAYENYLRPRKLEVSAPAYFHVRSKAPGQDCECFEGNVLNMNMTQPTIVPGGVATTAAMVHCDFTGGFRLGSGGCRGYHCNRGRAVLADDVEHHADGFSEHTATTDDYIG
ncbi:hypothetical protein PHYPSEUDO_005610 [Phytophthora pseudosyringae]|uniref:Uncharacterized protein n=1 Tax=Phytophthora pseudosyringae TaxID=221518 RepID=A0A8T1VKN5_9STRA|nr:hypothetical protein PHYPSEUDO_005610 [Phytophthora pseudosyringae]